MKRTKIICIICFLVFAMVSCASQTRTQKGGMYGAAGGAAVGAGLGQAFGKDTEATLWGAAIGAALGGLAGSGAGYMMDQQEKELNEVLAESNATQVRREGNLIALTLKGDVSFEKNSAAVSPGFQTELNRIADIMRKYPKTVIQVEGYTDSSGSEQYNMDLSQRRAESVKNILVSKGIASSRIRTIGFGETMPLFANDTQIGRHQNRRVEIKIAPSDY